MTTLFGHIHDGADAAVLVTENGENPRTTDCGSSKATLETRIKTVDARKTAKRWVAGAHDIVPGDNDIVIIARTDVCLGV